MGALKSIQLCDEVHAKGHGRGERERGNRERGERGEREGIEKGEREGKIVGIRTSVGTVSGGLGKKDAAGINVKARSRERIVQPPSPLPLDFRNKHGGSGLPSRPFSQVVSPLL